MWEYFGAYMSLFFGLVLHQIVYGGPITIWTVLLICAGALTGKALNTYIKRNSHIREERP